MTPAPRGCCRGGGSALLLVALLGAAACVRRAEQAPDAAPPGDGGGDGDGPPPSRVPARGDAATLDIASWNLEWFGDPTNGPADAALQLQNVTDVIAGTDFDLWGVVEVVDAARWASLESQLPGYAGLLANEPAVIDGPAYYSDFGNAEQKVGLLYKSSLATVLDARLILTAYNYAFGGRPPMQVTLRVTLNGATEDIVVIVQHPKCCTDLESWQRRVDASTALKAYLDATFQTQKVWVIGDFNDDLDTSITAGHASPYASFVSDLDHYRFPTQALTLAGTGTTVHYASTIDHHLNTNEANALYITDSVTAYRVDQYIGGYGDTTSDHYPVLSRYAWGSASQPRP